MARGLWKRFGATEALRGVDLLVPAGTVCGMLGPNGAGKTTAVRILATLLRPDAGTARVAGYDVATQADDVRYRIGLAGQHASVDERLTGLENLTMFGRLYHLGHAEARRRAGDVLERFDLTHAANRLVGTYSGGMRRRLDLVASLIIAPAVLFLDEPTTGLDPRARGEIWDIVRQLVADGTTVLLTTQYLDEADELANDIVVVDKGEVIASGTPDQMKEQLGSWLDVVVAGAAHLAPAAEVMARAGNGEPVVEQEICSVSVPVAAGAVTITGLVRELDRAGVEVENIGIRRPTLDEVFLTLTEDRRASTGPVTAAMEKGGAS